MFTIHHSSSWMVTPLPLTASLLMLIDYATLFFSSCSHLLTPLSLPEIHSRVWLMPWPGGSVAWSIILCTKRVQTVQQIFVDAGEGRQVTFWCQRKTESSRSPWYQRLIQDWINLKEVSPQGLKDPPVLALLEYASLMAAESFRASFTLTVNPTSIPSLVRKLVS